MFHGQPWLSSHGKSIWFGFPKPVFFEALCVFDLSEKAFSNGTFYFKNWIKYKLQINSVLKKCFLFETCLHSIECFSSIVQFSSRYQYIDSYAVIIQNETCQLQFICSIVCTYYILFCLSFVMSSILSLYGLTLTEMLIKMASVVSLPQCSDVKTHCLTV